MPNWRRRKKSLMREKKKKGEEPALLSQITHIILSFQVHREHPPLLHVFWVGLSALPPPEDTLGSDPVFLPHQGESGGASEPAESDPQAEPLDPLNINNPKMGCGCRDSCRRRETRARQDLWEAQLLQENPPFQACQSQSKDLRGKLHTWRNKPSWGG